MDTLLLALRVLLSLGAVLALVWVLHRRVNKGQRSRRNTSRMSVVARQPLGRRTSAVLLEVDGTTVLLGVTDAAVSVLHAVQNEAEPRSLDSAVEPGGAPDVERLPLETSESYGDVAARVAQEEADDARVAAVSAHQPDRDRQVAATISRDRVLEGSILSPTTWKRTFSALRQMR